MARDFLEDVFFVSLSVTIEMCTIHVVKVTLEEMEQYGVYMFCIKI